MLTIGDKAPEIVLPSSAGNTVSLESFKGTNSVVIYFYPKDDTPGCTTEALGFKEIVPALQELKTTVLGISPDSVNRHQKFITKYDLPFLLLSDEDKRACQAYGVWVEKSMYGRKYMGVARTTFIIDREGIIRVIFPKVKPKNHAQEVLTAIKSLNN